MTYDSDAIVVGSGPSGVSAAFPLLDAGLRVLMLDGGKRRDPTLVPKGAYHDVRRLDPAQWHYFLGRKLEVLRPAGPPSPKFDAPAGRFAFEGFERSERVHGRNFAAIGSLASGGLSNIWGAGIATYTAQDLAEFPIGVQDLAESYRRVAERIGVTGFVGDDLATEADRNLPSTGELRLSENAAFLLGRYERRRVAVHRLGLRIGRSRAAILTESRGERGACEYCDMCIWGCRPDAIYSATHDLLLLAARPLFEHRPGLLAERVRAVDGGYEITTRRPEGAGEDRPTLRAPLVILAAGGLVTTRLVLEMQGRFGERVPVHSVPGMGFGLCLPERIGRAVATREFSMAQLSFAVKDEAGDTGDAYGSLFPASGIPAAMVTERMPLTRPGAARLFRALQPALLFGNCFLSGAHGRNHCTLEKDADGAVRLVVQGEEAPDLPRRFRSLASRISRAFRRLGAFGIPGSFSPLAPGEAVRYSGMLPMRASPRPGEVDATGELHGSPGLHVVDLAIFPFLPAKHHTLTLMANADRIGRAIASRRGRRAGGDRP